MSVARRTRKAESHRADLHEEAYLHLLAREHNTASLAGALEVSLATATRVVEGLRARLRAERGDLVSVRTAEGWHYELRERRDWKKDPLVKGLGCVKRWKPEPAKDEDEIIYGGD